MTKQCRCGPDGCADSSCPGRDPYPVAQDEMIKACPHFGPSPARDQWIAGWEAARRANPYPAVQPSINTAMIAEFAWALDISYPALLDLFKRAVK